MYKLHAGRRELRDAERAALLGLAQAGLQAGRPLDPQAALSAPRLAADFMAIGPETQPDIANYQSLN